MNTYNLGELLGAALDEAYAKQLSKKDDEHDSPSKDQEKNQAECSLEELSEDKE